MEKKKTKSKETSHDVEFAQEQFGLVSEAIQKMYSQSGPEEKVNSHPQKS